MAASISFPLRLGISLFNAKNNCHLTFFICRRPLYTVFEYVERTINSTKNITDYNKYFPSKDSSPSPTIAFLHRVAQWQHQSTSLQKDLSYTVFSRLFNFWTTVLGWARIRDWAFI